MDIVDIHSHILPGADDGSGSMAETMEMLRIAAEEGITHMFATPHYQAERFFTDGRVLEERVQKLRDMVREEGIPIELHAGTEIYYRSGLEERLDRGRLATMNGTEYVLIEFSPTEVFGYIRNALEDIRGMGYLPILAHVERYQCLFQEEDKVRELRSMGCGIQANAGSVAGEYGFTVKRFTHKMLRLRLIDYIGTDAHNTGRRSPRIRKCAEMILKKCDAEYAEAILSKNAMRNLLAVHAAEEGCGK